MTAPGQESRPRLLQAGPLLPALEQALAARYAMQRLGDQADQSAFLAVHGADFVGYVTSAVMGLDAARLAQLPRLRVVSSFGVGLDRIDLAAAAARGVQVGHTPGVLDDCVADHAFALLLDTMRRLSAADRFVRRGDWPAGPFGLSRRVSGARLGLVGFGRIGQTIARRASGFDMAVRYHSRRPVEGAAWSHEPSLHALAAWADVLVVITAGGAATRHLIDRAVLDALGPEGFLVNVARGSVVDEAALVEALQAGRIAGAGLDVFADEPRVPEALRGLDTVVLTPHVASATRETRQAMADRVIDNLEGFFRDGRVRFAASPG
ncbi:MAG: hypothetical protein QG612_2504 [Pseudomonadota bacterium]|nr:hypothetical protein [Pseudomonadota bacterium]